MLWQKVVLAISFVLLVIGVVGYVRAWLRERGD